MIIVLIVLGIIITIASMFGAGTSSYYDMDGWLIGLGFGLVLTAVSIIVIIPLINNIKELDIIDKKIEMYQEENTNIENDIDVLVKQYMEHEKNTLKEFKSESAITLINLYPDLKANELVQQQLNIYVENNNKIKELKEKKLNYQVSKWWLYFGKVE